jgi:hypothetical protein
MSHAKHVNGGNLLKIKRIYFRFNAGRHFRVRDAEWGKVLRSEIRMVARG